MRKDLTKIMAMVKKRRKNRSDAFWARYEQEWENKTQSEKDAIYADRLRKEEDYLVRKAIISIDKLADKPSRIEEIESFIKEIKKPALE